MVKRSLLLWYEAGVEILSWVPSAEQGVHLGLFGGQLEGIGLSGHMASVFAKVKEPLIITVVCSGKA